jgi:hypothetical protein
MHKTLKSMAIVLGLAGATVAMTSPAGAQGVGVGLHVGPIGLGIGVGDNYGNVAYGYQDGYWDHHHTWHRWQNDDEMNRYRALQGNHYNDWRHDRDHDMGWRDEAR